MVRGGSARSAPEPDRARRRTWTTCIRHRIRSRPGSCRPSWRCRAAASGRNQPRRRERELRGVERDRVGDGSGPSARRGRRARRAGMRRTGAGIGGDGRVRRPAGDRPALDVAAFRDRPTSPPHGLTTFVMPPSGLVAIVRFDKHTLPLWVQRPYRRFAAGSTLARWPYRRRGSCSKGPPGPRGGAAWRTASTRLPLREATIADRAANQVRRLVMVSPRECGAGRASEAESPAPSSSQVPDGVQGENRLASERGRCRPGDPLWHGTMSRQGLAHTHGRSAFGGGEATRVGEECRAAVCSSARIVVIPSFSLDNGRTW